MGKPDKDRIFDKIGEPTMNLDDTVNRLNQVYYKLTERSTQARDAAANSRARATIDLISPRLSRN